MADAVMIRPKRNQYSNQGLSGFALVKKSANPDLSEHVFLKVTGGVDEYVHKDDYEFYKQALENKND